MAEAGAGAKPPERRGAGAEGTKTLQPRATLLHPASATPPAPPYSTRVTASYVTP